ncbi:MAG: MoaD/ThiS family protein [Candidatus Hodarchaeales archaeon]
MSELNKITIFIPTPLRPFTDNQKKIFVKGSNVSEALMELITFFPRLKQHLFNEDGQIRNFVNVYLNDEDIRYLEDKNSVVRNGDTIAIIPSIAGGK